jgi:arylformamidase
VKDDYRIVDISMPLSVDYKMHTPAGVKDVQFTLEVIKHHDQEDGDGQIVRALHARVHHGTHVDAPEHFVKGGPQISDVPLERFIGPAVIADVRSVGRDAPIEIADLEAATNGVRQPNDSLLIRTDWTENYGMEDYVAGSPYLSVDAVHWCARQGFPIVGLDFAHTKDPSDAPGRYYTTRYFCENGVTTMGYVKGLGAVTDQRVLLIALPLPIAGIEASPVRAVVLDGIFA